MKLNVVHLSVGAVIGLVAGLLLFCSVYKVKKYFSGAMKLAESGTKVTTGILSKFEIVNPRSGRYSVDEMSASGDAASGMTGTGGIGSAQESCVEMIGKLTRDSSEIFTVQLEFAATGPATKTMRDVSLPRFAVKRRSYAKYCKHGRVINVGTRAFHRTLVFLCKKNRIFQFYILLIFGACTVAGVTHSDEALAQYALTEELDRVVAFEGRFCNYVLIEHSEVFGKALLYLAAAAVFSAVFLGLVGLIGAAAGLVVAWLVYALEYLICYDSSKFGVYVETKVRPAAVAPASPRGPKGQLGPVASVSANSLETGSLIPSPFAMSPDELAALQ